MISISNNDVADAISDKKKLAQRHHDKKIMNNQEETKGIQIVSLGKTGAKWAGKPEPTQGIKNISNLLWDFVSCGIPSVWTYYGAKGEGVNVFVLDSGIDSYHSVFSQAKLTAKSFVANTPANQDACGHGTWVCGKIAGSDVGIAPSSNLHSLRVLDDSGTGSNDFTNKALEWILKQENFPHVINMSLGGPNKNITQEKLIWQLYKKGALIVVAAGNKGEEDNRFYPAAYPGVIAVGAVDKAKVRADFSDFGANLDVCAPGVACYSAYAGGGYRLMQGTSMAAPSVTGLLTLGVSYALNKGFSYTSDLRDTIKTALETSAQDLGAKGRDPYYGFGCIDGKGFMSKLDKMLSK
jgi:subtilisin family serine protease